MKHLLSIADLGAEGIEEVLRLTDSFVEVSARAIPKVPALRGKTVVSLFYEDSTRTRLSFETAAKRLSADTMTFSVSTSSVKKGESLRDTVETIDAMGVDAIVVRHGSAGVPWQVAQWIDACGHQRRRRLARAPHPGPARLLHDPPAARGSRRPAHRHRRRHQAQPGGPFRRARLHRPGRRRHAGRAAHPAAALPGGLAGRREPRPRRRCCPRPTSSTCCACSTSA